MRYVLAQWLHAIVDVVVAQAQHSQLHIIEIRTVIPTEIDMILLLYPYDANAASMRK
ncbi:hypothetical protein [Tissierella carlieri]|uniref:hypothetical protein n=1 Tax=Tissierella carlieri TaxID=689904 RepID=UPI0038658A24